MFTIVTGKGEGLHLRALGLNVTDSRWHQLVGVRSGSTFKLAIDGKILSTSENPNITQTDIGVPVRIGARVGSFINPFAGSIDDVRIYNRALSAGEVKALYDLEKPISKTTDLSSPPVPGAVKWNGHWYAVLTEPCPYEAAREKCKELGGHLAYVETQEENSFILGLAEKAGLSAHGVWLGGADEKNEGDWLWLNGKPIINTFWAGGQPGPGNYLVMFCGKSAQSIKGEWGVDISKGLSPVVCEWE